MYTVSGTQDEYHVDIWSGNHPFYQGKRTETADDNSPLSKFNEKYADMGDLLIVPDLAPGEPEGLEALKKKAKKPKN